MDDLVPTLTRHDYRIQDLVEQFDVRPTEIKALFSNARSGSRSSTTRQDARSAFAEMSSPFHSQLMGGRADGMHTGAAECKLTRD